MYLLQRHPWFLAFALAGHALVLTIISGNAFIEPVSLGIWLTSDADHVSEAKAFVKLAEPRIEKYYRINHRYPVSLASLILGIPSPKGLDYRVVGAVVGDDEWAVESDHEGERYVIFFGDLWYHGNGDWEVGRF